MSDHSVWTAAKSRAKKLNGNKSFKFPTDMKLGEKLDKVDSTEKAWGKANTKERDEAWAAAGDAYFKAVAAANLAASTYHQALPNMGLTSEARKELDAELSVNLMRNLTVKIREGRRMEPMLAKARK